MSLLPRPSAVVFVANVARMTQFYQTLASMARLQEDDQHAVLELEGFQLVIHALQGAPDAAEPERQHRVREDAYVKLCLPVESIAAARSLAASLGGTIRPQGSEWKARGFRACDGNDPEGNVLQVRETAA
jgi:predicted enzyme related to lactoylglutathione lyase